MLANSQWQMMVVVSGVDCLDMEEMTASVEALVAFLPLVRWQVHAILEDQEI
jgi:hypothetical protein